MQFAAFLRPICLFALGLVAGGGSLGEGAMLQQGGITFTRETEGSGAEAKAHQYVRVKRSTFSRNGQAADSRGTLVSEEYRTYALGVERNQGPLEDQIAQNLIGLRVGGKLVVRPNDARFNSYEIELLAIATIPTDTAIPELPEVVSRWATWVDRPKSGAFSGCTLAYGSSWVMVGSCLGHTFAVGPKPQQIYCRITDPYEHGNVGITNCMIDGGPMPKSMVLAKQEVTPDGLKHKGESEVEAGVVRPRDLEGVKLGMTEQEVRRILLAHNGGLTFGEYVLSPFDVGRADEIAPVTETAMEKRQLEARKRVLDHRSNQVDFDMQAPPMRVKLVAAARGQADGDLEEFDMVFRESDKTLVWIKRTRVFQKQQSKPRMDTVRKGLVDKYGPPSFQIPKVVDDLKLLWMFNAAGESIKGPLPPFPFAERQPQTQTPAADDSRIVVEILNTWPGVTERLRTDFAWKIVETLHSETMLRAAGDEAVGRARQQAQEWRKKISEMGPERFADSLREPPLEKIAASPGGIDSVFAITIGKPLPKFAHWYSSDGDQEKSPMLFEEGFDRGMTPWGTHEVILRPNSTFYSGGATFWMGVAHVELLNGVVEGVRFDRVNNQNQAGIVETLGNKYGKACAGRPEYCPKRTMNGVDSIYEWRPPGLVVNYDSNNEFYNAALENSTVFMLTALVSSFGAGRISPPQNQELGTVVIYTPRLTEKVAAYKQQQAQKNQKPAF